MANIKLFENQNIRTHWDEDQRVMKRLQIVTS